METGTFWTAFVFAVIPFVVLLAGLWWIDRYEKEPARLLVIAFFFGGLIAPVIAYGIEKGLDLTPSFSSQLIVPRFQLGVGTPLVEELVRGAAILIVFLLVRFEIDDALDGIIYGGVVGVGFGAAANFVSIWSTPALDDAQAPLYSAIISGLNHVFYGALIGFTLALARKQRAPLVLGAAVAGTGAAFGLHVLHDYLPWLAAPSQNAVDSNFGREVLTQAPNYFGVFILGMIAVWAGGRERMIITRELRDEIGGAITADEYAQLVTPLHRVYLLALDFLWRGDKVWRLRRRLHATQVELAFRKYHRGERQQTQSRAFHDEDDYRAQIRDLRTELAEFVPAAEERRRTEETPAPANTIVAGVGSLAAYLAVVGIFVLIWYLAFRPDATKNIPNIGAPPISSSATSAGTSAEPPGAGFRTLAAATAVKGTYRVFACQKIRVSRCIGSVPGGGSLPRQLRSFVIAIHWRNLVPGDEMALDFYSLDTRQPMANPRVFQVVRRTDDGYAFFPGPFPRLSLGVLVTYNGTLQKGVWRFEIR